MAKEKQEETRNTRINKGNQEMRTEEVFLTVLRENLLFMKHQETQRMWVANIFVAIVAGTLAYLAKLELNEIPWFIPLFFLIISLFCFFVTLKLNKVFDETKKATLKIFDDKKISLGKETKWKEYVLTLKVEGRWWKHLKARTLYAGLFALATLASLFFFIYSIIQK